MSTVCVLGAGSWGTTLAVHLADAGHAVRLWGHDPAELAPLEADRENRKFLPGIALPREVKVQNCCYFRDWQHDDRYDRCRYKQL